ncbi:hypothetical protein [Trinickia mobilis]
MESRGDAYRFAKDKQPGQMNGDGFKGVWHIAKP